MRFGYRQRRLALHGCATMPHGSQSFKRSIGGYGSVPESARLRKASEAYERALAAYEQEHAAEISAGAEAANTKLREMVSRRRRVHFVKPLGERKG
jgi:hypothetical protein